MRRLAITLSILVLAIVVSNLHSSPGPVPSRISLKDFPSRIGDWVLLKEQQIDDRSMAILQVDDYITRTYVNGKGESVTLYIGYFKLQKEGKTNHSPRQCLPGAGWTSIETTPFMLPLTDNSPVQIPVNRYLMAKGDEKELFLFWYQGRGRQTASEYMNKAYLIWDSMTKDRTDGALIRVSSKVLSDADHALQSQTDFIRSFYRILSRYIPE